VSPEGDPPRRRGQIRESGDAGWRATPGREPELVAAKSGKYLHHPDEGRSEFTLDEPIQSIQWQQITGCDDVRCWQCNFKAEISGWAIPVAFHLPASLLFSLPYPLPLQCPSSLWSGGPGCQCFILHWCKRALPHFEI